MPELPEIETIRLQLTKVLPDKKIQTVEILKNKSFIGDKDLIIGESIKGLRRFGKILVIDLTGGLSLAVHLKMSGQLLYRSKKYKVKIKNDKELSKLPDKYTRVILTFSDGDKLFFNDMRIFGWLKMVGKEDLKKIIDKLGPDPLMELDEKKFYKIIQSSKKPIKLILMDQEKIAGVGNIYANDSLFLSKIHPKIKAKELSKNQATGLFRNLQKVLRDGIKWKGASRNQFRDIYGQKGEVQKHFYVYNREGEDCLNSCGGKIKKIRLGGRGTFFCPACQRMR